MQVIGGLQVIKDIGIRGLKAMLDKKAFYRLNQELKKFNEIDNYLYSVFKCVKLDLQEMQSVKTGGLKKDDKIV